MTIRERCDLIFEVCRESNPTLSTSCLLLWTDSLLYELKLCFLEARILKGSKVSMQTLGEGLTLLFDKSESRELFNDLLLLLEICFFFLLTRLRAELFVN